MSPLRIAAVGYSNARPLLVGLSAEPGVELRLGTPAACAEALRGGRVDVALVPVVEVLRDPALRIVGPGVVAAERRVRSVIVAADAPLEELRVLHLSPASRTSNALAGHLCPRARRVAPGELAPDVGPAGRVVIGDPAFRVARESPLAHDLAAAWRRRTGLPFVFACFAARGPARPAWRRCLDRARTRGLAALEAIAAAAAAEFGEPLDVLRSYFLEDLHYEITDRDRQAMARFGAVLAEEDRRWPRTARVG